MESSGINSTENRISTWKRHALATAIVILGLQMAHARVCRAEYFGSFDAYVRHDNDDKSLRGRIDLQETLRVLSAQGQNLYLIPVTTEEDYALLVDLLEQNELLDTPVSVIAVHDSPWDLLRAGDCLASKWRSISSSAVSFCDIDFVAMARDLGNLARDYSELIGFSLNDLRENLCSYDRPASSSAYADCLTQAQVTEFSEGMPSLDFGFYPLLGVDWQAQQFLLPNNTLGFRTATGSSRREPGDYVELSKTFLTRSWSGSKPSGVLRFSYSDSKFGAEPEDEGTYFIEVVLRELATGAERTLFRRDLAKRRLITTKVIDFGRHLRSGIGFSRYRISVRLHAERRTGDPIQLFLTSLHLKTNAAEYGHDTWHRFAINSPTSASLAIAGDNSEFLIDGAAGGALVILPSAPDSESSFYSEALSDYGRRELTSVRQSMRYLSRHLPVEVVGIVRTKAADSETNEWNYLDPTVFEAVARDVADNSSGVVAYNFPLALAAPGRGIFSAIQADIEDHFRAYYTYGEGAYSGWYQRLSTTTTQQISRIFLYDSGDSSASDYFLNVIRVGTGISVTTEIYSGVANLDEGDEISGCTPGFVIPTEEVPGLSPIMEIKDGVWVEACALEVVGPLPRGTWIELELAVRKQFGAVSNQTYFVPVCVVDGSEVPCDLSDWDYDSWVQNDHAETTYVDMVERIYEAFLGLIP